MGIQLGLERVAVPSVKGLVVLGRWIRRGGAKLCFVGSFQQLRPGEGLIALPLCSLAPVCLCPPIGEGHTCDHAHGSIMQQVEGKEE
jgi:hypothetical protein